MNIQSKDIRASVAAYYGETLRSSRDLKTSACCPVDAMPAHLRPLAARVHPAVQEKFYGCGSPIPMAIEGARVLDLGCGTGRDAYIVAQLVGPSGSVIGVDMTEGQLAVAREHLGHHMEAFGYAKANVDFRQGYIEDLSTAGIPDASVDVVISNCVINLSPDKAAVFREIFRVLKPGGELYFSDVFAGRRIPAELRDDPVLVGECLAGALYKEDFRRLMREIGCLDVRLMSRAPIVITDGAIADRVGKVDFHSMTVRAFKLPLEDLCEDYGHAATYRGTIASAPHAYALDDHHVFETGRAMAVCGNTADMLSKTRLGAHFHVVGDFSRHFGPFDCAPQGVQKAPEPSGACC